LGKAFQRREADWDRSPLVLLIKLAVDLTLGTVGRLAQRAAAGRFARLFTRLTETRLGKRFLGRPAIRAFRATVGIGKTWARSLFSLNTLSGGFLGYAVGSFFGVPQLGLVLGGTTGWHYEFYLNIGKSERLMAWLQEPGANVLSRGFRAVFRIPARFFATHPYVRVPFKGLAFGYVLYLLGFPSWIIPFMGAAHWAWSTKGWWGPKLLAGIEKIPGVGRILGRLIGFLSKFRFLGLLGKLLSYASPAVWLTPLVLDILSGTPPLVALQNWLAGFWGKAFLIDVALRTSKFWLPALKGGLLAVGNFLAGLVPEAVVVWLSNVIAAVTSASALTLLGIALLVIASGFTLYLLTSAFFVERAISARAISPYLPIEKTVTPVKDRNGEIIALDYALTYTYQPPAGVTGQLDNIRVLDRFEIPLHKALPVIFDLDSSTITPSPPGCQVVWGPDPTLPTSLAWDQNPNAENPFQTCPWLGPLSPGENRTITLHFPLKNPPLSNFLKGGEMLCDTLLVRGQIRGGGALSSSLPAVCIDAQGEVQGFDWPTSLHSCCPSDCNFGWRHLRGGCDYHEGIDIPAAAGSPVRAAFDGKVCAQDWSPGYGCYTIVAHDNGLYSLYAHMYDNPTCNYFEKGVWDRVSRGDKIGEVGNTGSTTGLTGVHLHFAIGHSCNLMDFNANDPNKVENPCDYLPGCPSQCTMEAGDCP
jgi:hypothetical protein